jgi:glycosyltransferase involved in cell wall biosynthesis
MDAFESLAVQLCNNEPMREEMSSNARRLAESAFSVTAVARQITKALSES